MSLNKLLSTEDAHSPVFAAPIAEPEAGYSVAGKVFILGEYAVLGGAPAVVAAVGPRFRVSARRIERDHFGVRVGSEFHPKSPVARLLDWADEVGASRLDFDFADPFDGAGGFGASTAQFALAYRAIAEEGRWGDSSKSWEKVWRLYRELTSAAGFQGGFPPSGADLVAQWEGGVVLFQDCSPMAPQCEQLTRNFDWSSVLVFSAAGQSGRKVATHDHLAVMSDGLAFGRLVDSLRVPLMKGIRAIREDHQAGLGLAMNEYAETLRHAGLEIPATTEDRRVLSALPGVLGVKGAGALQADAIVVLLATQDDPAIAARHRADVIEAATARELVLVADGIQAEPGVS